MVNCYLASKIFWIASRLVSAQLQKWTEETLKWENKRKVHNIMSFKQTTKLETEYITSHVYKVKLL